MMLDNFLTFLRQSILDRIASPLIISFVFSWCLWNYKFIVILFSDASVTQTFYLIENISFPSVWAIFYKGFLLPLISTSAYIFGYPYVDRCVHNFLKKQRYKTYEQSPLSKEEAIEKNIFFKSINDGFENKIKKLEGEITNLTQENENHKINNKKWCLFRDNCLDSIGSFLDDLQLFAIHKIAPYHSSEGKANLEDLSKDSDTPEQFEQLVKSLDLLTKSKIIEKRPHPKTNGYYYELTSIGILIKNRTVSQNQED